LQIQPVVEKRTLGATLPKRRHVALYHVNTIFRQQPVHSGDVLERCRMNLILFSNISKPFKLTIAMRFDAAGRRTRQAVAPF
jgi:hypothetical protein